MKHPPKHPKLKTCIKAAALAGGLLCSSLSYAVLMNGDFSAGFDDWEGELFDGATDLSVSSLPGGYTANFDVSSGAAVITNDGINYGVTLFQSFTIQALAVATNTLWLDLDFSLDVSDPDVSLGDFVTAQLSGALPTLDISGGGPIDITSWAGGGVTEILFYVEDADFSTGDKLTIDNISITQRTASVPEPASLMLFLGAGLGLFASQRKLKV